MTIDLVQTMQPLSKKDKLQSTNLAFPQTAPTDDTWNISRLNAPGFNGLEVAWKV